MNNNPERGSTWKGRILVMFYSTETKNPVMKVRPLSNKEKDAALPYTKPRDYEVICEIGAGICLPSDNKKYNVRVQFGEFFF